MSEPKTVLIVDDEPEIREIFSISMENLGLSTLQAQNGREALQMIGSHPVDLIISDVKMPNGSGVELLEALHIKSRPKPKIIMISGFSDLTTDRAKQLGAEALVQKPCSLSELTGLVKKSLGMP